MAKENKNSEKLQIPVRQSQSSSSGIGPALGQHGVNIEQFVTSSTRPLREKGADIIPWK